MYHLNQFCNIITALRKERGWTQTNLADRIGIAPQSVSKWECGVGYPDVTLFPVIADLFGVPIGVLFGEETASAKEKKAMNDPIVSNPHVPGKTCVLETLKNLGKSLFLGKTAWKLSDGVEDIRRVRTAVFVDAELTGAVFVPEPAAVSAVREPVALHDTVDFLNNRIDVVDFHGVVLLVG